MTRSATGSPFFTAITRTRHRVTSLMKSSSSNSSSSCALFFWGTKDWKQHRSCIFRRLAWSFRCVAVVFCASLNIWQICPRRDVSGPSSGTSTACAEVRAEADPLDLRVAADDFRATVALEERVERADARPGMVEVVEGGMLLDERGREASTMRLRRGCCAVVVCVVSSRCGKRGRATKARGGTGGALTRVMRIATSGKKATDSPTPADKAGRCSLPLDNSRRSFFCRSHV